MSGRGRACAPMAVAMAIVAALPTVIEVQRTNAFTASRDHPAIAYSKGPASNVVAALNDKLTKGLASLSFDASSGYLRSVLDALGIPVESQVLVYSQTSFQARRINRGNPRAVYFSDRAAVGWVRDGEILEVAAQDATQGTIFYTVTQSSSARPAFVRDDKCLACHLSWDTRGVPGPMVLTTFPRRSDLEYANGFVVDHRAAVAERWGGWFVTGARVPTSMGNLELIQPKMPSEGPRPVAARSTLDGVFDKRGYPTLFSDVVALMVLEHQVHATNLITRAGWEHRIGSPHVAVAVDELVDYLLFVDEAPLPHPVRGSAGFAEKFASTGPRDGQGRSLRDLDLDRRMMRYPLSYMIYSPGFAGLPDAVQRQVRARLDDVLSGRDANKKYGHLTPDIRLAIREILADTL